MPRSPRRRRVTAALAAAGLSCLGLAGLAPTGASASTPADSGTLTPSATPGTVTKTYTGTIAGANSGGDCTTATTGGNDPHAFTVAVPAGFYTNHSVKLTVTETADAADSILSVQKGGTTAGSSDSGSVGGSETFSANNPEGAYNAITCAFAGTSTYSATITLETLAPAAAGGPVGGTSPTAASTYSNYPLFGAGANPSIPGADSSGEPSIGVDWTNGNVYFQANLNTIKAVFPPTGTAAPALTDVSCAQETLNTLDPIMYTDSTTGRTGTSQLLANPVGANSITSLFQGNPTGLQTTCTPSNGGGQAAGPDHQTLGGGTYPKPTPTGVVPDASGRTFYYCSQTIAAGAICARSDNGGAVFTNTPGLPYTTECGGLHGHIRVGPEGNAYLPNKSCGGKQGFSVTKDAGTTWNVKTVSGSTPGATDPSVSADRAGTAFLGYVDGDGKPKIATTSDAGNTFSTPVSVGDALGIKNATWAEVIAGDAGRAAFAFVGSTLGGDRNNNDFGKTADKANYVPDAVFHMYLATTIDNGQTYKTVDITPTDPVQRGAICTNGTTCMGGTRNLLDFNDIVVDKTGHVLVGYADGCVEACVTSTKVSDNAHSSYGTIARQVTGPLLFASAAGDPNPTADPGSGPSPVVPEAPVAVALPLLAVGGALLVARRRRRQNA